MKKYNRIIEKIAFVIIVISISELVSGLPSAVYNSIFQDYDSVVPGKITKLYKKYKWGAGSSCSSGMASNLYYDVEYQYRVNGITYTSRRLNDYRDDLVKSNVFLHGRSAGDHIRVYYNGNSPDMASLSPVRWLDSWFMDHIAPMVLMAFIVSMVYREFMKLARELQSSEAVTEESPFVIARMTSISPLRMRIIVATACIAIVLAVTQTVTRFPSDMFYKLYPNYNVETTGLITRSNITRHEHPYARCKQVIEADFEYTYIVNGKTYTSNRVETLGHNGVTARDIVLRNVIHNHSGPEPVTRGGNKIMKGMRIRVLYDKDKPDYSVVEETRYDGYWYLWRLSILALVASAAFYTLKLLIRYRGKRLTK